MRNLQSIAGGALPSKDTFRWLPPTPLAIPAHHHRVKKTTVYEPLPSSWLIMVKTADNL